jgi:hypothetical protein
MKWKKDVPVFNSFNLIALRFLILKLCAGPFFLLFEALGFCWGVGSY